MRILVWFRSDLRVEDQPALHHACAVADSGVIGAYVTCPRQWRKHDWGAAKVDFVLRNVAALSKALRRLNIPLLLVRGTSFREVPKALLALARRHRVDAVYFNQEYEVNEWQRDHAVMATLARAGLRVERFEDQTIIPPSALRTRQGGYYGIYSPFRRAWAAELRKMFGDAVTGLRLLAAPKRQADLVCQPDPVPPTIPGFTLGTVRRRRLAEGWPAGGEESARRLRDFISKRLRAYREQRDIPAIDGTSRLSPYLAAGVISSRRCLVEALEAQGRRFDDRSDGPTTWIDELVWREFYRHVMVGYPRISMNRAFRPTTEKLPWREDDRDFAAWVAGRTGYPLVDAAMRQLAETGWMHNRLRMVVAMFLTKDLFIDWRKGEQYFMQQLIDGDLANNNGGWQWAASTGTDAVPYFRVFNPLSQSRRFDPDGTFIRRYVPELGKLEPALVHDPSMLSATERRKLDYPPPICDHRSSVARTVAAFRRLKGK